MDLGCLDLGCVDKQSNGGFPDSPTNLNEPATTATSKVGKNKALKEAGQSNLSTLNKFTSQIKKPPHRKTSPLNWFPRKKVDSYLKRKIKLLQEVGGMNSTLDETLGDSNPHYSRVLREKIAVRAAAHMAMEARKAAMVEASWCRILQAARIQSKEAEVQLQEAEKRATEAFEAATAIGVIMYDMPDCRQKHYEIETSAENGAGLTTHTVTTSFETAFEVDKQVAAAVKSAFVKLASCPSINKDEFKELLRKISQNPDAGENNPELSEFSLECELDTGSELEPGFHIHGFSSQELNCEATTAELRQMKYKKQQISEKCNPENLVDMMLERLRCLQEDELASLATIVATCGLNAALAEAENSKQLDLGSAADFTLDPDVKLSQRISCFGGGTRWNSSVDAQMRRKRVEAGLPSLDKFLVKHLTKLEREVQDAKNARMNEAGEGIGKKLDKSADESVCSISGETIPDLGTILLKHSSRLEKEIEKVKKNSQNMFENEQIKSNSEVEEEMKRNSGNLDDMEGKKSERKHNGVAQLKKRDVTDLPSLDKFLVKHVSKLEREVQEAKNRREIDPSEGGMVTDLDKKATAEEVIASSYSDRDQVGKENIDLNKKVDGGLEMRRNNATLTSKIENSRDCSAGPSIQIQQTSIDTAESLLSLQQGNDERKERENSLVKIPEKAVELEREKMQALPSGRDYRIQRYQKKQGEGTSVGDYESLDKVLVKHVSRLEKEKLVHGAKEEVVKVKRREPNTPSEMSEGGLDQILVKHKSRLEKEKMAAAQQPDEWLKHSVARREAGGTSVGDYESLDKVLVKHVSRLEKEKMVHGAKIEAVKVKRRELNTPSEMSEGGLDQILVKHESRLEKEKIAAAQQADDRLKHSVARREARERELQEAWGGLSLGNSMRPHVSRIERDKAAWLKAEEEERKRAVEA